MSWRHAVGAFFILVASLWASAASAACANPSGCSCQVALTTLAFGNYNPQSGGPSDSVGTISVSCVSGDPTNSTFSIALSAGSSGNANARMMKSGIHPLYYNLYTNVARTVVWGDDSGGGESVVSNFPPVSRTSKQFSVYGRIPAGQNAWAGTYYDAVMVTVTY